MKKRGKKIRTYIIYKHLIIILVGILLLAFADFIVLEKIYHPLASQYNVPWSAFDAVLLGRNLPMLWWHVAFFPLAFLIFILLAVAAKNWRLGVSGIVLFATGWEDIFYYLIQGKWLPSQLSWLNPTLVGMTRFITQTEHVTSCGVIISAVIGLIISIFILFSYNPLKLFIKGKILKKRK